MITIKYIKNIIILIIILLSLISLLIYYFFFTPLELFKDEYILPRIIWIFWDTEELPKNISLIFNNNKNKLYNWDIKLLNNNNLKDYLDITIFPKKYNDFSAQHKADLIRLKLLKQYGGVWIDAGIIINNTDELENIFKQSIDDKNELTAFTLIEKDNSYKYHQYIENWFLIAPKNSKIISLWLEEFEKAFEMGFDEYGKYITDIIKINICDNITQYGSYLTQHKALQVVLQNKINYESNNYEPKILLLKSEDSMFKLQTECNWDIECIKSKFENNIDIKKIPYIKLVGSTRQNLNLDTYFT
jgi:hypothetical protein